MSEKDGKTEKPTPKKLRDARKKGELAKSQEFNSAISFAAFVLLSVALSTFILQYGCAFLSKALATPFDVAGLENNLNTIGLQAIIYVFRLAGPFLGIAFVVAFISNIIQTGFFISAEPLKFKFSRLDPISGMKNIFSKKALFNLVKNLVKLCLIGYVAYRSFEKSAYYVINAGSAGTEKLFFIVVELVQEISTNLAIMLFVLGITDYIFQKYDYKKNLSMTKQEIKEEFKQMEGDQQVKSQRKQKYRQMTRQMLKDVETATVVITNPTHLAIAIAYDKKKHQVPIVVAKGADYMAEIIKERAKAFDVPTMENKPVARAIYKTVEAGQPIPMELYEAIAEMIAIIYQMNEIKKKKI